MQLFYNQSKEEKLSLEGIFLNQEYLLTQENEAPSPKSQMPTACSNEEVTPRQRLNRLNIHSGIWM